MTPDGVMFSAYVQTHRTWWKPWTWRRMTATVTLYVNDQDPVEVLWDAS